MVESATPKYALGRRAAIIGSGLGGLAAAIRLAAAGFETVMYGAGMPGVVASAKASCRVIARDFGGLAL